MKTSNALFLFLLVVIGCAPITREKMQADLAGYSLPRISHNDSSLVFVVRPSSLGTLIRFNVFLDNKESSSEMGYTRGGQHIYFNVKPGAHIIFSNAENWGELSINTKPGESVFILQEPQMGLIMARNSLKLLDSLEGAYYVKHTNRGTFLK